MPNSIRPRSCRWCGGPLADPVGPGRPRRYCCRAHRQRFHDWSRMVGHPISIATIAVQTEWICGICGAQVDPAGTDGARPSIDHIVPVSRGGTNDLTNLQLTHYDCNVAKGNRMGFTRPPITNDPPVATSPQLTLFL